MESNAITFPARLIISRPPTGRTPGIFCAVDCKRLEGLTDLSGRLYYLATMAELAGCPVYTYTPAAEAEAEAEAERIRAELQAKYDPQPEPQPEPEPEPEPEPVAAAEADYLGQAHELARAKWAGNDPMLRRVDRALALARAGKVWDRGGGVWWVASDLAGVWTVNGSCGCPDYVYRRVEWCKHRIAVALVRRAAELKKAAEGDSTPPATEPAPIETAPQAQLTTGSPQEQAAALVGNPDLVIVSWIQESPTSAKPRAELKYADGRQEVAPEVLTRPLFDAVRANGWARYGFNYHRRPSDGPRAEADRILGVLAQGLD